jgi:polyphosphate kinase
MMRAAVALALVLAAGPAAAHPHIFIDTELEVIFDDQGRATHLRVTWIYDDFYSLLTVEDRGLDPDGDGVLTPEESAALQGFDMNWDAGFAGDTYALSGAAEVALGPPGDWTARYEGGRVISTHLRALAAPVRPAPDPLIVQVYDPGFYSAYYISAQPVLTGAPPGCTVQVFEPDRDAADAILQAALDELAGTVDIEMEFPAVGAAYAEEARITCAGA